MDFGSEKREARQGECRTTEDVGRLFARYRAQARHYAKMVGMETISEPKARRDPPVKPALTAR